MGKRKGSKPTRPPTGISVRSQMTTGVVPTARKTRRDTEVTPGPPAGLLSVTVLPRLSSLISTSKIRDGCKFLELPTGAQHGLPRTPSPVPSRTQSGLQGLGNKSVPSSYLPYGAPRCSPSAAQPGSSSGCRSRERLSPWSPRRFLGQNRETWRGG